MHCAVSIILSFEFLTNITAKLKIRSWNVTISHYVSCGIVTRVTLPAETGVNVNILDMVSSNRVE